VFLSYASQDVEAARRICDALRAGGIEVWFDKSELRGGDAWDRQIRQQIQACALFMPIISANAHARVEGYFRFEWKLAVDRSHRMAPDQPFLVPVVIDDTRQGDTRIPDRFRELQWTGLPGGETPPAFVERVRRLVSLEPSQAPKITPPPAALVSSATLAAGSTFSGPKRALAAIVAVVVFGAVAYLAIDKFWISKHLAASAAFAPPQHSIAVLPFVNMSGDKEQEYFSDGLTEEILNSLARINQLQVSARTSSFSFKGKDTDINAIARKLNVGSVLEGSVRRSGTTIRVTAQLNNAVTGFHLWSQTYDRDLGDVLKLQSEIADAVVGALKVTLLGDVAAKIELGGTRNPAAFDAYLRGVRLAKGDDEGQARTAVEAYTEALRLDPDYALAFAGRSLALTRYVDHFVGRIGHEDVPVKARADAERAITLAQDLAEGHVALSTVLLTGFFEFGRAGAECDRATALAPGNATVLYWCSTNAAAVGHFDTAITAARRGTALDPVNPLMHISLGDALQAARRHDEAIKAYREAVAVAEKPDAAAYARQGLSYYMLGNLQKAYELCNTRREDWESMLCLAITLNKLGKRGEAEAQLHRMLAYADRFGGSASMAYQYAQIEAQWGDLQSALDRLELALRLSDSGLVGLKIDQLLDPLRKEPRFQAIERQLKFPD
jgi:TolB-like protein/tetratricopeptide (TPR) repeat protein